ncbi:anti-sigma factor [Flavobacterium sp. Fl-77]|uniref:Anti-sigma factor n=1 Tax=Flavobacterium flavipigmentatum TaxID=2893884 RepID=A0AAJ2SEA3_9FLAO|nr:MULTISPECIES: anti-sigma factor [unclassified Flavobacterium]MDX6182824.1 anti-sigma factor [Flavobacterium sp. Fl-33]MDX6186277.1 anti-sigma factor [Flavobacterium sp. Fl-77]UFH37934.1 anti-sigma factor [Flavobacterium sp. F-70]
MEAQEYIESGTLELYVYGLLTESENLEIAQLAKTNTEIEQEIIAIERAIVALSSSFSPFHSVANFEKIKAQLELKHAKVIDMKPASRLSEYAGWAAAVLMLLGVGYQTLQLSQTKEKISTLGNEKTKIEREYAFLGQKNAEVEKNLTIVRDIKNTGVTLGGQAVSPKSFAKVYWNKETKTTYIDAAGLPKPPKGMVYQVWALKLSPVLTPTSIGLLSDFDVNDQKIFAVKQTDAAEAFGITLEPAGGSLTPTMEQLYTLGKV